MVTINYLLSIYNNNILKFYSYSDLNMLLAIEHYYFDELWHYFIIYIIYVDIIIWLSINKWIILKN